MSQRLHDWILIYDGWHDLYLKCAECGVVTFFVHCKVCRESACTP